MTTSIFITGTDTGVGKTRVSCALLYALSNRGLRVAALKPVASGAQQTAQGWRNEDALQLQQGCNVPLSYEDINPYCLQPAIAPHLAAEQAGVSIELPRLQVAHAQLAARADVVVVEGAGGWRVPINAQQYLSAFPESLAMPVVLVVGLRLGCINHAVLSVEAITAGSCRLLGWVGNSIDPDFQPLAANIATLKRCLPAPCLGVLPYQPQGDAAAGAAHLSLPDSLMPVLL